ncbi:uncharacterized protein CTRU02_203897 [Colletotrichum truncatum]|uniref:Uncharacterized protein n=1 Tax=Colletotrichum truncatum TaxID=5467 RepID=A0ACC3ZAL6_COLTU|nr:uncharacterized protein CTRU02_04231 [Colletotrichum truncatum]KAF6796270.1 hypothetical protein CTRU02_04231 [Colletotrichum truncatum]
MTSRRFYFDASSDPRHQYVHLKRTRSHHRHGRHHYDRCCRDDCCHIGKDEWNDLVERERKLREDNECLARENNQLKCDFQAAETEARRLAGIVPVIHAQNKALKEENAALRCSIENAGGNAGKYQREVERLRHKLHRIERERDALIIRVKELSRHCGPDRAEDLRRIIITLERKFDVVDDHNKRLRRDIEDQRCIIREQDERLSVYERILRRHGLIRCN